jgi:hypothetical protein
MKAQLLVLTSAALLLTAGAVQAAPHNPHQLFIERVSAQADARLADVGVALTNSPVRIRTSISGDRLGTVQVVQSSGDPNVDRAIEKSLRKMPVSQAPAELAGRQLVLTLGSPSAQVMAR